MKKRSGIYEYLKERGLLHSSNSDAIAQAKKDYLKEYKRKYKQERLKKGKEYKLYFGNKAVRIIQKKAKEKDISETTLIREAVMQFLDKPTAHTDTLNRILHVLKIIYNNEKETYKIEALYKKITDELLKLNTS